MKKRPPGKLVNSTRFNELIDEVKNRNTFPAPRKFRSLEFTVAKIGNRIAGAQGRYDAMLSEGAAKADASGNLAIGDLGAFSSVANAEVWDLAKIAADPVLLFGFKAGTARTPIYLRLGGWIRDIRYNSSAGWIQTTAVSDPQDSDWVNKIQVNACPSNPARSSAALIGNNDATNAGPEGGFTQMTLGSPNVTTIKIDTACTDFAGTNSVLILTSAGGVGSAIVRIDATALGNTSKGAIRIFHQPGGSGSKYFVGQIDVPETTVRPHEKPWSGSWTPEDSTNGFLVESGDKVYVGTYVADSFNVKINAADLT